MKDNWAIKITLELPPLALKPNVRVHHIIKAKAVAEYRLHAKEEAMVAAFEHDIAEPFTDAVVAITFYHKTKKHQDADNILASLKAAFDGLTDAGIWADDRLVVFLPVVRETDSKSPRVELTLYQTVPETWQAFVESLKFDEAN